MPCPYSVRRFLPDRTPAGGSWVFGYPCENPSQDPVTGACPTHREPADLGATIAALLRA